MGCVDLSEKSLEMFDERLQGANNDKVLFSKACCASELEWVDSDSADTILRMGPMYHIIDNVKRKSVVSHCHRIIKNGGYLISMFLSPYPALMQQNIDESILWDISAKNNCLITTTSFKGFRVPQYRCWPKNAISEFQHFFSEKDFIHVDEIEHPIHSDITEIKDNCSHQYFVVFKKEN